MIEAASPPKTSETTAEPGHVLVHPLVSVQPFLATKHIDVVTNSPHFPDLVTCDLFLFLTLKSQVQGQCFQHAS